MARTLDLAGNFKSDAEGLRKAREEAIRIHATDIRAAGNEVEQAVRDYFKRLLPSRYYVTSGHLIDTTSPAGILLIRGVLSAHSRTSSLQTILACRRCTLPRMAPNTFLSHPYMPLVR